MLKILQQLLETEAIRSKCDGVEKFYVTDEEIISHIQFNYKSLDEEEILQDINGLHILVVENRFLGISVILSELGQFSLEQSQWSAMKSLEEYQNLRESNYQRAFAQLSPSLPWRCYLMLKFASTVKALAVIIAIASAISLGKYLFKWYKYYETKRNEEVINMVENILDTFRENPLIEYLVINHVRDTIIPLNQRPKMDKCWRKVVNFINEHESRIRTEVKVVRGEECEVWRWLGNRNVSFNSSGEKSWQGQAFETLDGSPNSAPRFSTACLKIRGMLDVEGGDVNSVKDAILSKCGEQCHILHFAIKHSTQCVYLKCASKAEGSLAYRSLHGWWYSGRLVTVKYLFEETYLKRFPESANATTYLTSPAK